MIDTMKTKPKKKSGTKAGSRDLTAAVAKVHPAPRKPRIKKDELTSVSYAKKRLADTPDHLLLSAGDMPDRDTFFDLDDSAAPRKRGTRRVHLVLERGAALPDYRTRDGKRTHRSMITLPPKMRESIKEVFGVADGEDFPFTTALIALADYGAMALKRDKRLLVVSPAEDEEAEERKEIRKLVRTVGLKT